MVPCHLADKRKSSSLKFGVVSQFPEQLRKMVAVIVVVCTAFGLTVSEAKTEIMCIRTKEMPESTAMFSVEAAGQVYNQTNEFVCVRPFRAPIWCPSGGWRHARSTEHCRGEPGSALSGGYAPDSVKAEGSSIVDEPGEYGTPVRENQRREPGGF